MWVHSISSKMKSYRFLVSGRVQGVYYRANVAKNALNDGRVEACVSCREEDVEKFKKILQKGSPLSKVNAIDRVEISDVFIGQFEVQT